MKEIFKCLGVILLGILAFIIINRVFPDPTPAHQKAKNEVIAIVEAARAYEQSYGHYPVWPDFGAIPVSLENIPNYKFTIPYDVNYQFYAAKQSLIRVVAVSKNDNDVIVEFVQESHYTGSIPHAGP
jgi:hypothetical protein